MSADRLVDYINQMVAAAEQARGLTEGMDEPGFLADVRTQLAVAMTLVLVGETVARLRSHHPEVVRDHADIAWDKMETTRDLIVRDYDGLELPAIWKMVRGDLELLISQLDSLRHWRVQGE